MFGFRLQEAPHVGGIDQTEVKRGNYQLLAVLDVFHLDFTCRFSVSKPATLLGGAIVDRLEQARL